MKNHWIVQAAVTAVTAVTCFVPGMYLLAAGQVEGLFGIAAYFWLTSGLGALMPKVTPTVDCDRVIRRLFAAMREFIVVTVPTAIKQTAAWLFSLGRMNLHVIEGQHTATAKSKSSGQPKRALRVYSGASRRTVFV